MKSYLALLAALALAPPSIVFAQQQAATADKIPGIVQALRPRMQLRMMILRAVAVTTTGQMVVNKLGEAKASALFSAETDKVVAKYGDEWERNLGSAYREALTPDEIDQAARAAAVRDQAAMMPFMNKAGRLMEGRSTPLLQKSTAEVLVSSFESSNKAP